MQIAIVDDLAQERTLLRSRLERLLERRAIHAELSEFENGESFLEAAKKSPFQVVFLDIYMTGANGIEIAGQLREFDTKSLLIFTTSSADFALEAWSARAFHYLVKPYPEVELERLLDEILEYSPQQDKMMDVKSNGSSIRLRIRDILYAEHHSHMIYIYTVAGRTLSTRQTLSEFIAPLQEEPAFFQCNRGIIVNLEHATDLQGNTFILTDGSQVPVSRDLVKAARQSFMDYLLRREKLR